MRARACVVGVRVSGMTNDDEKTYDRRERARERRRRQDLGRDGLNGRTANGVCDGTHDASRYSFSFSSKRLTRFGPCGFRPRPPAIVAPTPEGSPPPRRICRRSTDAFSSAPGQATASQDQRGGAALSARAACLKPARLRRCGTQIGQGVPDPA